MASNPASEVEKTKRLIQQAALRVQLGRELAEQTWEAIRGHVTCFSARNAYSRH